jgi:hypothetical protein
VSGAGIPAFILCRDRLTPLLQLVDRLEQAGFTEIHFVDYDSAWPPLLTYYETTPHSVHRRRCNPGPRELWAWDELPRLVGDRCYLVSDPDVVPDAGCPLDWPEHLRELLRRYPARVKAGLGLRIDDLPDHYEHKQRVVDWEGRWWTSELEPGVWSASIDTTRALCRPLAERQGFAFGPSIRTGPPYVASHLPWYERSGGLSDEERFYRARATAGVSHWLDPLTYDTG